MIWILNVLCVCVCGALVCTVFLITDCDIHDVCCRFTPVTSATNQHSSVIVCLGQSEIATQVVSTVVIAVIGNRVSLDHWEFSRHSCPYIACYNMSFTSLYMLLFHIHYFHFRLYIWISYFHFRLDEKGWVSAFGQWRSSVQRWRMLT